MTRGRNNPSSLLLTPYLSSGSPAEHRADAELGRRYIAEGDYIIPNEYWDDMSEYPIKPGLDIPDEHIKHLNKILNVYDDAPLTVWDFIAYGITYGLSRNIKRVPEWRLLYDGGIHHDILYFTQNRGMTIHEMAEPFKKTVQNIRYHYPEWKHTDYFIRLIKKGGKGLVGIDPEDADPSQRFYARRSYDRVIPAFSTAEKMAHAATPYRYIIELATWYYYGDPIEKWGGVTLDDVRYRKDL